MSNIKKFSSRKEVTEFLATKGIDTSSWSEVKWLSLNKGQAEIHMMDLAEKIYDAVNESTPKQLQSGEWHIPFENKIDGFKLIEIAYKEITKNKPEYAPNKDELQKVVTNLVVKIAAAMAARTSYTVVGDEKEVDYQKMIELHDRLIEMRHDSPLEHCARAMSNKEYREYFKGNILHMGCEQELYEDGAYSENVMIPIDGQGWCRNYKGFIQYRHIIEKF